MIFPVSLRCRPFTLIPPTSRSFQSIPPGEAAKLLDVAFLMQKRMFSTSTFFMWKISLFWASFFSRTAGILNILARFVLKSPSSRTRFIRAFRTKALPMLMLCPVSPFRVNLAEMYSATKSVSGAVSPEISHGFGSVTARSLTIRVLKGLKWIFPNDMSASISVSVRASATLPAMKVWTNVVWSSSRHPAVRIMTARNMNQSIFNNFLMSFRFLLPAIGANCKNSKNIR